LTPADIAIDLLKLPHKLFLDFGMLADRLSPNLSGGNAYQE
jgi:hypothetical protein